MAQYTTGEAAKMCGITVRTVQYWDERGIVSPSELTDGGRRLYSDEDLSKLEIVCFLKELGFSLKNIKKLMEDPDKDKIIEILADEQIAYLESELAKNRALLEKLHCLKASLRTLDSIPKKSLKAIATVMDGRKKLRNLRIMTTVIGVIMDICLIGSLLLGIFLGLWWLFGIALCIDIVLGVIITRYYMDHVAYICPDDRTVFRPPFSKWFFATHSVSTRKLACPNCDKKVNCVEIYAPDSMPKRIGNYLIWESAE